jgi:hypothetical protein
MQAALNRATTVYLCVFAVFVVGIWVILEMGSALLTAPRDLSGNWRLVGGDGQTQAGFTVQQSGRFFRFVMDRGPRIDLVMASRKPEETTYHFQGQGWTVTGNGPSMGDSLNFSFQPPPGIEPPPSGTYQRQRMGQVSGPGVKSATQPSQSPAPNANH